MPPPTHILPQLGPPAQFESHVLMEVMQKLLTSDHAFMGVRGKVVFVNSVCMC